MDTILCDELIQEIFHRLPPPSSSAVSLVSKRWLRLLRSSQTSLSLRLILHTSTLPFLSSFLSHYHHLSSLTISTVSGSDDSDSDHLLLSVASSCLNLRFLRFLTGPVSLSSLLSLSTSCSHLSSLSISLSRPLFFHWLVCFPSLKHLFIACSSVTGEFNSNEFNSNEFNSAEKCIDDAELELESLSLSGIRSGDYGLNWLWRNCKRLNKLQLRSCESVGDNPSFYSFLKCLNDLREVELRTCRAIVDGILLKLAENCTSLNSLLIYDGGSREGLLQFITQSQCNLQKLDLRLPLDLDNNHLSALSKNFRRLSSLRLQSCCLVTGKGLNTVGIALSNDLEELALINCDIIERETGLLTTLGQNLRSLRNLDLSYNDMLLDKELISMLASCNYLRELKLRGCSRLTSAVLVSMFKNCKHLESVDIVNCCGIEVEAVEIFVLNSPRLRRLEVEELKISDVARNWASVKFIDGFI